ncbi:MAG: radical SAM protein [Deltaproteobacteria bacterium]|nr:radical SAM protein [Deltaproteobacteria bacterium]
MSKKKRLIIPIFIPFAGCPSRCVFCDQEGITGKGQMPSAGDVTRVIESHLASWKGSGEKEAAFYGGTFTALPVETQRRYLEVAFGYVRSGGLDSLRVSTRPDCVSNETVELLTAYGVKTVELGVQSMDDEVLKLSGRGHGVNDSIEAVRLLKEHGLTVGLQFMPGLPGDTEAAIIKTAEEMIALRPAFARVYPALVLKGTALHRMYLDGQYSPWPLDEMVKICERILTLFNQAGIPIVRMGLQPTTELRESIVDGPYHPSFRQLVDNLRQTRF